MDWVVVVGLVCPVAVLAIVAWMLGSTFTARDVAHSEESSQALTNQYPRARL